MTIAHAPHMKKFVRDIPDFPKKGIVFKDITPLLKDPQAFSQMTEAFCEMFEQSDITHVAVIESRGFLLGSAVAYGGTSFRPPHMCPALSIPPYVRSIPLQSVSWSMMSNAALVTQVSPPWCLGSLPGMSRLPCRGYIHAGLVSRVP